ncbi:unnamed protein product [Caenorhabditis bovis]|uniref:Uncharacterized protein n=1 Tax=Caenorhabditis bovis TaxID=2654633 RepID=A0A8S1EGS4_9PELO|nr:unnamed protein product [Caenorhabditis bovis]
MILDKFCFPTLKASHPSIGVVVEEKDGIFLIYSPYVEMDDGRFRVPYMDINGEPLKIGYTVTFNQFGIGENAVFSIIGIHRSWCHALYSIGFERPEVLAAPEFYLEENLLKMKCNFSLCPNFIKNTKKTTHEGVAQKILLSHVGLAHAIGFENELVAKTFYWYGTFQYVGFGNGAMNFASEIERRLTDWLSSPWTSN